MQYSIGKLSELAGVSARTLRYYDEIGLLKPLRTNEAGCRFYGEKELARLQQILFYRERGFELKRIKSILNQADFDMLAALEEHLLKLEEQRDYMDALIHTVKQTIKSVKGECQMSDKEKFEAFKKKLVRENEKKYGAEVRSKYGEESAEASNAQILNMTEEEMEQFKELETELKEDLEKAVTAGADPEGEEGKKIVELHREWLCMAWAQGQYTKEAHKGIAAMYVSDERFRQYYDENVPGCAEFLEKAVKYWIK